MTVSKIIDSVIKNAKWIEKTANGIGYDSIAHHIHSMFKGQRDWEEKAEKSLRFSFQLDARTVKEIMNMLRGEDYFDTGDIELQASNKKAIDFPTEEAMKKYLQQHPDADPSNHKVVKTEEGLSKKIDEKKKELKKPKQSQYMHERDLPQPGDKVIVRPDAKSHWKGTVEKQSPEGIHIKHNETGKIHYFGHEDGDPTGVTVQASFKKAIDFPTEKAMKKYLEEHPAANPANHKVVEQKEKKVMIHPFKYHKFQYLNSIVNEIIKNSSGKAEMSEALWKIDKWMPEDEKLQNEFEKIVNKGNIKKLIEFFENNMDEEQFRNYAPNVQLKDFAKYVLEHKK